MNKKGISPIIIATLILIGLAVVAGMIAYWFTSNAFPNPQNSITNSNPINSTVYNAGAKILTEGNDTFYFHGIIDINSEILIIGHQTSTGISNMEFSGISNSFTFWLLEHQYQIVNFTQSQITLTELNQK
jgi:hypothetical protein